MHNYSLIPWLFNAAHISYLCATLKHAKCTLLILLASISIPYNAAHFTCATLKRCANCTLILLITVFECVCVL